MNTTGTVFKFYKKVDGGDSASKTPERPKDDNKVEPENMSPGDKAEGGETNLKSFVSIEKIKDAAVKTIGNVTSSIRGSSYLQAQANAFNNGLNTSLSLVSTAIAAGPYAALSAAGIAAAGEIYNQFVWFENKAWSDYDLEEYRQSRGIGSSLSGRSRGT